MISFQEKFSSLIKLKPWISDRDTIRTLDLLLAKSNGGRQLYCLTENQAHTVERLYEVFFGEFATEKVEFFKPCSEGDFNV